MAHLISISPQASKEEKYISLLPQIESLIAGETNLIANLANISAALKQVFDFFWVGFYLVEGDELVLGPFQGPVACTRIKYGKGVCGTAWKENRTIIVPDVDQFPGHIACSSESRSEIVLPLYNQSNEIIGVLDIDSDKLNSFDEIDAEFLNKMIADVLIGTFKIFFYFIRLPK
ncbi:GAF domain-containing protein [Bacteroidales bacterium OttesenSCG-928-A17]|nr:GAF domain-containing protein [Bacteroidales bacterium OttesenSCG-928-A17]